MTEVINIYAKQALRTIAFAYKDLKRNEGGHNHEDEDKENKVLKEVEKTDMVLISIAGIKDIIRKEVPEAVETCKRAGITVRMVTGDNRVTAMAIAKECNIISSNQLG